MRIILVLPFPGNRLYPNRFLYPSFTFTSMLILSYLKHARTHAHTHTRILDWRCSVHPCIFIWYSHIFTQVRIILNLIEPLRLNDWDEYKAIEFWWPSNLGFMTLGPAGSHCVLTELQLCQQARVHTEECHPRAARHGPGEGEGKAATNANIMRVCSSFQSF